MAQSRGMELAPSRNVPQCPAEQSQAQLSREKLQDHRNWAPAPGTQIPGEGWCWGWDSSWSRTGQAGAAAPHGAGTGWHQPGAGTDQAAQGTFHWEQPQSSIVSAGGSGDHSQGSVQLLCSDPGARQVPRIAVHC